MRTSPYIAPKFLLVVRAVDASYTILYVFLSMDLISIFIFDFLKLFLILSDKLKVLPLALSSPLKTVHSVHHLEILLLDVLIGEIPILSLRKTTTPENSTPILPSVSHALKEVTTATALLFLNLAVMPSPSTLVSPCTTLVMLMV